MTLAIMKADGPGEKGKIPRASWIALMALSWINRGMFREKIDRPHRLKVFILGMSAAFGLGLSSAIAQDSLTLVTDIDDTLRVSHVSDRVNRLIRFVFSNRSFSGMQELFQSWKDSGSIADFVYLSAAPELVRPRVELYLDHQGFPMGRVILKKSSDVPDLGDYKVSRLDELVKQSRGRLILVGDDTQADPGAYLEIFLRHPDRIAEIYIRKVAGVSSLPWPVRPFLTSYDVARSEYVLERLNLEHVKKVAGRIVSDPRNGRVLPPFQKCPSPPQSVYRDEVAELDRLVDARVKAICERRSWIPGEEI